MVNHPYSDWRDQILAIACDWLFEDVPEKEFPESVILPLENPDLHEGQKFLARLELESSYRTLTIGRYGHVRIGLCSSKFGAPAVAMTVGALARRRVKRILGVGFCGGFREDIRCGTLVLPLACVRDDGVSSRYVGDGYPAVADFDLLVKLRSAASVANIPSVTGIVFSTDAILLECTAKIQEWARRDVIAADMESGALLTLARLAGVQAASILVASDNPATNQRADPRELLRGVDGAIRIAFEALFDSR